MSVFTLKILCRPHAGKEVSAGLPVTFNGLNYILLVVWHEGGGHKINLDILKATPCAWHKCKFFES